MVTRQTRGDLGQGAGRGGVGQALVPRMEDTPEDFVWGGGLPLPPQGLWFPERAWCPSP